jgi:hypothetical protein
MAGSILAARNDTPERSAMVQGWATRPRGALADGLRRHAGDLDREQIGGAVAHG